MTIAASAGVPLELDPRQSDEIDEIARATDRARAAVINDAIQLYLDNYRWQLEHIQQGLREADAGEFASDEELAAFFALGK